MPRLPPLLAAVLAACTQPPPAPAPWATASLLEVAPSRTSLAREPRTGCPQHVTARGRFAFAADGEGLSTYRVDDGKLVQLAHHPTPGFARWVALRGDRAFVADGAAGLAVFDVASPERPRLLVEYRLPGGARRVQASPRWVAVLGEQSQVSVLSEDGRAATLALPGDARDLGWLGDRLFVADAGHGLVELEVGEGPALRVAGADRRFGWSTTLLADGERLYLASLSKKLHRLSPSLSPQAEAMLVHRSRSFFRAGEDLFVTGYPVVGRPREVSVLDASSLQPRATLPWRAHAVASLEGYVVAAVDPPAVAVAALSAPDRLLDLREGACVEALASDGRGTVLGVGEERLLAPNAPLPQVVPGLRRLVRCQDAWCVLDAARGLCVTRSPSAPLEPSSCTPAPDGVSAVVADGPRLWVGTTGGEALTFELRAGLAPTRAQRLIAPSRQRALHHLAVEGQLAVATDRVFSLLYIVERTPAGLALRGVFPLQSTPNAVALRDQTAYVAQVEGLQRIDVTHPSRPAETGWLSTAVPVLGLALGSPTRAQLALALGESGVELRRLDAELTPLHSWDTEGNAADVLFEEDRLLVADGARVLALPLAGAGP